MKLIQSGRGLSSVEAGTHRRFRDWIGGEEVGGEVG